jgi:hypothetical protein
LAAHSVINRDASCHSSIKYLRSIRPPAGPRSGPIGPIFAVELVQLFTQAPKPCVANVTAPEDNKNLRDTLIWIHQYGAQCDIRIDSSPKNIDDPLVPVTTEPGVVIHYSKISPLEKRLPISLRLVALKWQLAIGFSANDDPRLIWIDRSRLAMEISRVHNASFEIDQKLFDGLNMEFVK